MNSYVKSIFLRFFFSSEYDYNLIDAYVLDFFGMFSIYKIHEKTNSEK